jgi:hypothetical protein
MGGISNVKLACVGSIGAPRQIGNRDWDIAKGRCFLPRLSSNLDTTGSENETYVDRVMADLVLNASNNLVHVLPEEILNLESTRSGGTERPSATFRDKW